MMSDTIIDVAQRCDRLASDTVILLRSAPAKPLDSELAAALQSCPGRCAVSNAASDP
jgi:hypothetical protein